MKFSSSNPLLVVLFLQRKNSSQNSLSRFFAFLLRMTKNDLINESDRVNNYPKNAFDTTSLRKLINRNSKTQRKKYEKCYFEIFQCILPVIDYSYSEMSSKAILIFELEVRILFLAPFASKNDHF